MSRSQQPSTPNSDNSGNECDFVQDNAEAFALRALSDEETGQIVAHLATHPACRRFVDDALAVVNLLPFSMPLLNAPDLAIKLRLFDRIATESASHSPIEQSRGVITTLNRPGISTVPPPAQTLQHNRTQYLSTILLAPLAIALMVVSLWAFNLNDELNSIEESGNLGDQGQLLSNTLSMYSMESPCEDCSTRGQIGAMPDQTSAVLLAWDLDPAKEHEVWCEERDGKKWMVSLLDVNADGEAMQTLKFPKPIDGYQRIFVSGSGDSASDAPELVVIMPEDHDEDTPESGSPPSW